MAVASPELPVSAIKEDLGRVEDADAEDVEEVARTDGGPKKPDFGLQIGFEEILVDVDPRLSLDYLQKADALAGKPPPQRTPKDKLVATHNSHVEKQRSLGPQKAPRMVKKVILALAYPPSSKTIDELEKMPLSDLLVENHHQGKMITVRTITPAYVGAGAVAIVEDEWGNVEKVALYNQGDASVLSAVEDGTVLLIKEPYYKFSGDSDFMLCVDHPADVRVLRPGPDDDLIPAPFRREEEFKLASEWRDAGDRAFMKRNLPLAKANYTRGLEVATAEENVLKRDLYAKRAGTNLGIKCYDEAIKDALDSRGGSADWRPYFVAARAAYELASFDQSKQYFESALEHGAAPANVRKEYERCLARVREQETGDYDWASISKLVTTRNIHLDRATYNRKTEVRESPHHGRGLFATRDIRAGEVIYAEKATCVPNEFNPDHNSAASYAQLVELCRNNASVHDKVLDLYGGTYKRSGREGAWVDGRQVLDVYLLESIRRKNCFSGTHVTADAASPGWNVWKQGMSRGVWAYSAYSNHACMPNSNRSFVGDMLISVAVVDIKAETEVTQIYMPPKAAYQRRADQYRTSWGFTCGCDLCVGERASPAAQHEKRYGVLGEIEAALKGKGMNPRIRHSDASIRVVEKLAARLEALHEAEVYDELPRLTLVWPTMWLLQAYHTRRKWTKVVRWGLAVLRNFGFVRPLRGADGEGESEGDGSVLWVYRDQNAVITFETTKAFKSLEHAWRELGEKDLSAQARAAGMKSLKAMAGFVTEQTYEAFQ